MTSSSASSARSCSPRDRHRSTFAHVADELHRQYALGFTPMTLDGKMHTLEVRVAGAGMTARARRSYLARSER